MDMDDQRCDAWLVSRAFYLPYPNDLRLLPHNLIGFDIIYIVDLGFPSVSQTL